MTMTERQVLDLLAARHSRVRGNGPEWVYMEHVRDDAGHRAWTTIDALAMHLWPSKRHALHAFEVKVSRADWRRELGQPHKSAPWLERADFFWVAAPSGVVQPEELPKQWGLLEVHGPRLMPVVAAQRLRPTGWDGPQVIDRGLVAAMMRSAARTAVRAAGRTVLAEVRTGTEDERG